jgi:hypothetical protein
MAGYKRMIRYEQEERERLMGNSASYTSNAAQELTNVLNAYSTPESNVEEMCKYIIDKGYDDDLVVMAAVREAYGFSGLSIEEVALLVAAYKAREHIRKLRDEMDNVSRTIGEGGL